MHSVKCQENLKQLFSDITFGCKKHQSRYPVFCYHFIKHDKVKKSDVDFENEFCSVFTAKNTIPLVLKTFGTYRSQKTIQNTSESTFKTFLNKHISNLIFKNNLS